MTPLIALIGFLVTFTISMLISRETTRMSTAPSPPPPMYGEKRLVTGIMLPADCVSSYGYRDDKPPLSRQEWEKGLRWKWDCRPGHTKGGIMACYLAKADWKERMTRLWEQLTGQQPRFGLPVRDLPAPIELPEFQYPYGLNLDDPKAFWFHLDLGGNPRDPGFKWSWEKPLLPTSVAKSHQMQPPAARKGVRSAKTAHLPMSVEDQPWSDEDKLWNEYLKSDIVSFDQFKLFKAGKLVKAPSVAEQFRTYEDSTPRPHCPKCGQSHPECLTPMHRVRGVETWNHAGSYYQCQLCRKKWKTGFKPATDELIVNPALIGTGYCWLDMCYNHSVKGKAYCPQHGGFDESCTKLADFQKASRAREELPRPPSMNFNTDHY